MNSKLICIKTLPLQKVVCKFCNFSEAVTKFIPLLLCQRCFQKYFSYCLLYRQHLKNLLNKQTRNWSVKFINGANFLPNEEIKRNVIFFLLCSKGTMRIITSVDRTAFFAVMSRLSTDLSSLSAKKSSSIKIARGKRK